MKRITVLIEGKEKRLYLDKTLNIDKDNPEIFIKSATVYWNYNNVFTSQNETFTYDRRNISINPGYWTFDMLVKKFKSIGKITLTKTSENGKCVIESDEDMNLKNLGLLLGFTKNKVIEKNTSVRSDSVVDINHGLHYITICCDAVDKSKNFYEGKRSCMITSLPIPTNQTLQRSVSHFNNIDSRASINKGQYNSLEFSVFANNNVNIIGSESQTSCSVLLELYIKQKINENQRICY